ncbi:hypothetical protein HID58_062124 [Brassica napus]|uniref:Uncharacterized protein n=1 Tax=Brassica napus TaxID=3708 RepID=A0ABQ8A1C4_BRANA|nr:hypothetical protein HID58_062124 [Brassica napus]
MKTTTLNLFRLIEDGSDQTPSSSKLPHAQKLEPLTISKLNNMLSHLSLRSNLQHSHDTLAFVISNYIEFLVLRQIKDAPFQIFPHSKIHYMSVTHYRYRVELSVSDLKDDAVFVAFDMEIVTLTSIQASEAAQILV